jgi:hypothetical protein
LLHRRPAEEVVSLITRKNFTEPEIVKYDESLDKVTLGTICSGKEDSPSPEND